jgi:calcium-dependent protein kinase
LLVSSKRLDIMLIDFGLCFKWKKDLRQEVAKKEGKGLVGTAYYMAPEIFKGTYDETCDVWSLGIILFMLVTGEPPVNGTTS